jgi:hypothetical protein
VSAPQTLQIQSWSIDRLILYARNPRKNEAAVDRMCGSLREFGFKVPALARSDGTVVDGHLRWKAARKLESWPDGDTTSIPVILCDEWTDAQVKAFRLLVNSGERRHWGGYQARALATPGVRVAHDINRTLCHGSCCFAAPPLIGANSTGADPSNGGLLRHRKRDAGARRRATARGDLRASLSECRGTDGRPHSGCGIASPLRLHRGWHAGGGVGRI